MTPELSADNLGKLYSAGSVVRDLEVPVAAKALSDNWRVTKSSVMGIDLANALESLTRVIGYTGVDWGVEFNSNPDSGTFSAIDDSNLITIDPILALEDNVFPIKGANFDVLVGLACHEAMHVKTDAKYLVDRLGTSIFAAGNQQLGAGETTLGSIAVVGEEITADFYGERHYPKIGEYIKTCRKHYLEITKDNLNWNSPIQTWLATAVYGASPLSFKGDWGVLAPMFKATEQLRDEDNSPPERLRIYREIWEAVQTQVNKQKSANDALKQLLKQAPQSETETEDWQDSMTGDSPDKGQGKGKPSDSSDSASGESGESGESSDSGQDQGKGKPKRITGLLEKNNNVLTPHDMSTINKTLEKTIKKAVNDAAKDRTAELDALAKEDNSTRSNVRSFSKTTPPSFIQTTANGKINTNINDKLRKELEFLQRIKNSVGRVSLKGEIRGSIDKRRLHRYFVDGGYRKRSRKLPEKELKIVFVVDSSSSMHEHRDIYDVVNTVKLVLPEAVVYNYGDQTIQRHPKGRYTLSINPDGWTASGDAVITAAIENPDSLILHFTDGELNSGITVESMYRILNSKFPQVSLVNILWKSKSRFDYPAPVRGQKVLNLKCASAQEFATIMQKTLEPFFRSNAN